MKEVTSEQLDISANVSEEESTPQTAQSSQEKDVKKTESRKKQNKDSEAQMMDALEKVRQEERAKLEALQAREREKTKRLVEKERAKLEAELEKEIKALEAQLAKERAKIQTGEPVPSISLRDEIAQTQTQVQAQAEPAPKKKAVRKVAAKKAKPKEKEVFQTVVGPVELGEEKTPVPTSAPAVSEQMPAEALGTPDLTEGAAVAQAANEEMTNLTSDVSFTATDKAEAESVVANAENASETIGQADVSAMTEAPVVETPLAQDQSVHEFPITQNQSVPEISLSENQPVHEIPLTQDQTVHEIPLTQDSPVLEAPIISESSALETPLPTATSSNSGIAASGKAPLSADIQAKAETPAFASATKDEKDARTVINSLEKLREKIFAQKRLERELLEKEATKTQEKDRLLLEKISQFTEELQEEDLQGAQAQLDSLLEESEKQKRRIEELEAIINKVKALKIDNISIIDENTFEISNDFALYATDAVSVNKLIKEIETELENLNQEHQRTIAKLRETEAARDQYYARIVKLESERDANQLEISKLRNELENKEKLYLSQINNLNNAIQRAEEKLNEEKVSNRDVLLEIEQLKYEKQKLMNENTGLKAEIEMLKEKLNNRLDASVSTAARIDLLEAEKSLLENKILQLNKQLIMKERLKPGENADEPYSYLLSEIRRLQDEVNQLKTRPFPFMQPDYSFYQQQDNGGHNCPYVRFFNPQLIPNLQHQPQALNEQLVNEIRQLKKEFEAFKQEKNSNLKSDDVEDQRQEENNFELDETKQKLEEYSQKLKEYQEELEKNKADLSLLVQRKNQEIERLTKDYETKIQAKDNEKNMIKAEKEQRIRELQQKIQEKDAMIDKINQEVQRLTEDDILDPEFRRKIRVIRDMRRECEEKAEKQEEEHLRNVKAAKERIDAKNLEIDVINDKIFQLEMNFRKKADYSDAAKDEYEKTKSKLLLERQLQEEKLHEFEDDMSRLQSKHEEFLKNNAAEIEKLNNQEADTIEFYLNKLRRSRAKQMERKAESEKSELNQELDQLKDEEPENQKPDVIEVDPPFPPKKDENPGGDLENEINELTRQYSEYYRQITELKTEQDKRVDAEKRLRLNEKKVYDYCSSKINLDECLKAYQEKSRLIETKENELNQTGNRPEDRNAQLKLKAELQDLEVHRNDLRAKIDFYRKQIQDLEKAEIVQKYKSLLAQMEKINIILKEKREKAQEIKALVQAKTKELEMLRG